MFPVDPVTIIIVVAVILVSMSLRVVKEYDRGVIFFGPVALADQRH